MKAHENLDLEHTESLQKLVRASARFFGANEEAQSHQSLVLQSLLEVSYLVIRKSSTNGGYLETSEPMGSFAMVSQVASRYKAFLQSLSWFECSWASRVRILLILGTLSFLNSVYRACFFSLHLAVLQQPTFHAASIATLFLVFVLMKYNITCWVD